MGAPSVGRRQELFSRHSSCPFPVLHDMALLTFLKTQSAAQYIPLFPVDAKVILTHS